MKLGSHTFHHFRYPFHKLYTAPQLGTKATLTKAFAGPCLYTTGPREVLKIGWDEFLDEPGIILVEWADKFPELMPEDTRWFRFKIEDDGTRTIQQGTFTE